MNPSTDVQANGLVLDIGGVVLRGAPRLLDALVADHPELADTVERLAIATDRDELWHQMLRQEVSERAYWAQRAAELGAALGEDWDTRTMINRMYDRPDDAWLATEIVSLMVDVRAAGLRLGALTNDLADFHGADWVARQRWLDLFEVVIDASVTGVMKPDPRAFAAAAEALGLPPAQIVYLDDMPWNVAGGRAAGLQAIQVEHGDAAAAATRARALLGLHVPVA